MKTTQKIDEQIHFFPRTVREETIAMHGLTTYIDCIMEQLCLINRAKVIHGFDLDAFQAKAQTMQKNGSTWQEVKTKLAATLDRAEALVA